MTSEATDHRDFQRQPRPESPRRRRSCSLISVVARGHPRLPPRRRRNFLCHTLAQIRSAVRRRRLRLRAAIERALRLAASCVNFHLSSPGFTAKISRGRPKNFRLHPGLRRCALARRPGSRRPEAGTTGPQVIRRELSARGSKFGYSQLVAEHGWHICFSHIRVPFMRRDRPNTRPQKTRGRFWPHRPLPDGRSPCRRLRSQRPACGR